MGSSTLHAEKTLDAARQVLRKVARRSRCVLFHTRHEETLFSEALILCLPTASQSKTENISLPGYSIYRIWPMRNLMFAIPPFQQEKGRWGNLIMKYLRIWKLIIFYLLLNPDFMLTQESEKQEKRNELTFLAFSRSVTRDHEKQLKKSKTTPSAFRVSMKLYLYRKRSSYFVWRSAPQPCLIAAFHRRHFLAAPSLGLHCWKCDLMFHRPSKLHFKYRNSCILICPSRGGENLLHCLLVKRKRYSYLCRRGIF